MKRLERLDELRMRAEEALRRSLHGLQGESDNTRDLLADKLSRSQIELLLENETMRRKLGRMEAELNVYQDLYREAPLAYITFDQAGNINLFNKVALKFLPADKEGNAPFTIYDLATQQSLNDLREIVEKAFRTGLEQTGYLQLLRTGEGQNHYKVILFPMREEQTGEPSGKMMISPFPDQENYYKNALKKKEKELNDLLGNISEGLFYAEKGILHSVNPSLSHLLGYSDKELEGRALWDLAASNHRKLVKKLFLQPGEHGQGPSIDIRFVRSDGSIFWADLRVRHLSPGNRSFGTISDITERKRWENQMKESEKQLMRSNAAKDKLFSIISHDLKTPFNTLMGYTYLLMKDYRQYDEVKREAMVRSLYDVTKQTFNMLENILVWSRSQTGGIPFAPRAVNLPNLLLENIRLYTPTARAKSISLSLEEGLPDLKVFADPEMVQTVIRNLVTNAIKFTPEKGSVQVGLTDDGDEKVTVYVRDTGVGIRKDKKSLLFHIDSSFSTRGTNDEKGTGLGLTVCKEFVEKNGGEIWVDSKPGDGSTFYFTLYKKADAVD